MTDSRHDILAGEYVLGTLDEAERARADALRISDAGFSAAVSEWEARLNTLAAAVPGADVPAGLWDRIENRIDLASASLGNNDWIAGVASQIDELKKSLAIWRASALTAGVAVAAVILAWIGGLLPPLTQVDPPVRYVAMLQGDKGETGFLITMDMDNKQFAIKTVSAEPLKAKSYELWAIMKGDKPPMTLGLVSTGAYAMVEAPAEIDDKMLREGIQLAISLEPMGGAPQGKPMGPVIFAGNLIQQTP
jgi:anti-sigma-K factor RskA